MTTQTQGTQGYEIDGEIVTTLKELADLLGVEKVTKKDITEGEYKGVVSMVDLSDEQWENATNKVDSEDTEDDTDENVDKDTVYTALSEKVEISPEEIKNSMPEFEDLDELKGFIKDLDTPTLEYMAVGLQLEWTPTYHANIHRMRIAMAMQRHFFPELFQPKDSKKKNAKYGDLSTDQLFAKADEASVEYTKTGNEPIDRMKIIMALKKSGHLA